jgi:hypothetical protein
LCYRNLCEASSRASLKTQLAKPYDVWQTNEIQYDVINKLNICINYYWNFHIFKESDSIEYVCRALIEFCATKALLNKFSKKKTLQCFHFACFCEQLYFLIIIYSLELYQRWKRKKIEKITKYPRIKQNKSERLFVPFHRFTPSEVTDWHSGVPTPPSMLIIWWSAVLSTFDGNKWMFTQLAGWRICHAIVCEKYHGRKVFFTSFFSPVHSRLRFAHTSKGD